MNNTITTADVRRAAETLKKYKAAKASLEKRVVENERWYKLRHWEVLRKSAADREQPVSAWLFSSLASKHADAMDAFPVANVLPREESDRPAAERLSKVLPVVFERCGFEQTYSDCWWYKLKNGTAVYGIFWDPSLDGGVGDVSVRKLDLLNVFWQPGITDIQQSRDLFIVGLQDTDLLTQEYPQLKKDRAGKVIDVKEYVFDESVSTEDKTLVVDWYYKKKRDGRTVLHYCKFAGETLLYASENDELYAERGYYDHGRYPVVFDVLFPEEGTPVGFGYVDVMKDPQAYIDRLSQVIMENTVMTSKPRFFIRKNAGLNPDEFLDWSKPLVEVEGEPDETRVRQIIAAPVSNLASTMLQMKINELKETSGSRDFTEGGVRGGVTAASAIIALQEAGNKISRDVIAASYRAFARIGETVVELIRQFYKEGRVFRVTGPGGYDMRQSAEGDTSSGASRHLPLEGKASAAEFFTFSNEGIAVQETPAPDGGIWTRRPVFDIRVSAEKKSPFSRMEQNELAKELFAMGFFRPENREAALMAMRMLDFEGKAAVEAELRAK
ncbi:MAG: hypothetical protein IJL83_07660 [Clostridia bacterium]|nr:hypothetical protein [Clostridia bacterium]